MIRNELSDRYFEWMCQLVKDETKTEVSYRKLLYRMYETDFYYIVPMDENRESDGVDLRYRFGFECGVDNRRIASELDIRPCSVLEMMIALAIRCEESIMNDPEQGNRYYIWFWLMITNLGLLPMTDDKYNEKWVDTVIDIFLDREYEPNGSGGLFIVEGRGDLRKVEIWYQMCWYLGTLTHSDTWFK